MRRRGRGDPGPVPGWVSEYAEAEWIDAAEPSWLSDEGREHWRLCRWNDARLAWLREHPAQSRAYVEALIADLGTPA